jgi:lipid-A-disaccharide synthase-like uncharacterized protein
MFRSSAKFWSIHVLGSEILVVPCLSRDEKVEAIGNGTFESYGNDAEYNPTSLFKPVS